MLLLTRRPGQSITIQPGQDLDPAAPLGALFLDGPIAVQVSRIRRGEVRLGIAAHRDLVILREELAHHYLSEPPAEFPAKFQATFPANSNPALSGRYRQSSRENLARNIYRLCRQRQWTTTQLLEVSHLSFTTMCAMEFGKGVITLDDLDDLAQAFEVSVMELLRA